MARDEQTQRFIAELKQVMADQRKAIEDLTKLRSIHNGSYAKSIDIAINAVKRNLGECELSDVWDDAEEYEDGKA